MTRNLRRGLLGVVLAIAVAAPARAGTQSLELAMGELQLASASRQLHPRHIASVEPTWDRWLFSGGLGFSVDPTGFLTMLQLEHVAKPWLYYGPFVEMIFPSGGVAFTGGATIRATLGGGVIRPSVEAGAGITVADAAGSSVGFHFHFGIGAEYRLRPGITLATMLKPSFNPPIDNFWLAWPVLIGRFAL